MFDSSTARQLDKPKTSFFVIAWMAVLLTGCGRIYAPDASMQSPPKTSDTRVTFDAGVVLEDRESYLCLRFEQLGLLGNEIVESVTSSCDCIKASVVSYRTPHGSPCNAVLLHFMQEKGISVSSSGLYASNVPVSLGVLIDLKLADGSVRQLTLNFLSTSLAQEVSP